MLAGSAIKGINLLFIVLFILNGVVQASASEMITATGTLIETNEGYELLTARRKYFVEGDDLSTGLNRTVTVVGMLERDDVGREFILVDSFEVVQ